MFVPNEIEVEVSPDELQGLEAELVLDPEEVLAFAQETGDLQGLEDVEQLERLRRLFTRFRRPIAKAIVRKIPITGTFRRIVEKTTHKAIQKVAPYLGKQGKAKVWYHKKKLVGNSLEFFSTKDKNTNIPTSGLLADNDVVVRRIGVWFEPAMLNDTQMADVQEFLSGILKMKVGSEEILEVPVSMIADFNIEAEIDGSTSATTKYFLKNSRLDRGMLILDNVHIPKDRTVEVRIDEFSISTYHDVDVVVALAGVELA